MRGAMWTWLLDTLTLLGFSWAALLTAIPAWAGAWFAWRNFRMARERRREEAAAREPQFELALLPSDNGPNWFDVRLSITNRQDTSLVVEDVEVVRPSGAGLRAGIEPEDQGELRPDKAKRLLPLGAEIVRSGANGPPSSIRRTVFVHRPARAGKRLVLRVKCLHRGRTERLQTYVVEADFPR